jgi:hypothetical protein
MAESTSLNQPKSSWAEQLKPWAPIIAICSLILTLATFVGLKPEKRKRLEWQYLSKSTLINQGLGREKITITYDERKIPQLTTVMGKLVNTGDLPIDSSDVKDQSFASLTFANPILAAEIKAVNPRGIKATTEIRAPNTVVIDHGLLNPGDAVTVQVILEGEVGTNLPPVDYRIAGIKEAVTTFEPQRRPVGVVLIKAAPVTTFLLLFCGSVGTFVWVGILLIGLVDTMRGIFTEKDFEGALLKAKTGALNNSGLAIQRSAEISFDAWLKSFGNIAASIKDTPPTKEESAESYINRLAELAKARFRPSLVDRLRRRYQDALWVFAFLALSASTGLIVGAAWLRFLRGE